jgi:hypothetical protein
VLVKLAVTSGDSAVGCAAVANIKDVAALVQVAKTAGNAAVAATAVDHIQDSATLAELARLSGHVALRACGRLTDRQVLQKLIMLARDPAVRRLAISMILPGDGVARPEDKSLLVSVVTTSALPTSDREYAFGRLATYVSGTGDGSDERYLADIAASRHSGAFAMEAVKRVTDTKVLADISKRSIDPSIRAAAAAAQARQERLDRFIESGTYSGRGAGQAVSFVLESDRQTITRLSVTRMFTNGQAQVRWASEPILVQGRRFHYSNSLPPRIDLDGEFVSTKTVRVTLDSQTFTLSKDGPE